jgi:predicted RNA binding protein YcfA (HicA-like mRNA interferase family)
MKLPRDVSGDRLADMLCRRWQYKRVHQSGSHIVIETEEPAHQRIAVPAHHAIRVGTFNSILRAVATHKGVTREEILSTL